MRKVLIILSGLVLQLGWVHAQFLGYRTTDSLNGKPRIDAYLIGRIKFNGIYDVSGNLFGNSSFLIHNQDINAKDNPGIWMDLRQSQLRFNTVTQLPNGKEIQARLEADFEGGPDNRSTFRIRHAYIVYGRWTLGQNWSTFGEGDLWPASLFDWDGPTGMINSRRPMFRYTQPLPNRLKIELAAEIFEPRRLYDYTTDSTVHFHSQLVPDFIAALRWDKPDVGFLKVAGIYCHITYGSREYPDRVEKYETKGANGYGVTLLGSLYTGSISGRIKRRNNLQFQFNTGKGIADYYLAIGGFGFDGYPEKGASGILRLTPTTSGYVSYQCFLSSRVHMTGILSAATFNTSGTIQPYDRLTTWYGVVNAMYDVLPNLTIGAEYLGGLKQLKTGSGVSQGDAQRFNFGMIYNFN